MLVPIFDREGLHLLAVPDLAEASGKFSAQDGMPSLPFIYMNFPVIEE